MLRQATFDLCYDSSYFTPLQLHPVAAVRLAFLGWARWADEHAVPFPVMIRDYQAGFAVVGVRLTYHDQFGFLDGARLCLASTSRLLRGQTLMETTTRITASGKHLADVSLLTRALTVDPERAMAAVPGAVPASIAERYLPGETSSADTFTDRLTPYLRNLEAAAPFLANGTFTRVIDRQLCEAADQWCFTEITGLLCSAREHLVDVGGERQPILRQGLLRRISSLEFKLSRPMFLSDTATIHTALHRTGDHLIFAYRITGDSGHLHGQAMELLEPRS